MKTWEEALDRAKKQALEGRLADLVSRVQRLEKQSAEEEADRLEGYFLLYEKLMKVISRVERLEKRLSDQ